MYEKTEELRDIFLDVADDDTVTESQQDERGTLATDGESVDERLKAVIETVRKKFEEDSALSTDELCQVVRKFYAGQDDSKIARTVECDEATVFDARMALHLVRDDDIAEELESQLRERDISSLDAEELATALDEDVSTVERGLTVLTTTDRSRRVSYRYRTAFEEVLTDADLTVQFTAGTRDDGLEDATEGAETNVEF